MQGGAPLEVSLIEAVGVINQYKPNAETQPVRLTFSRHFVVIHS